MGQAVPGGCSEAGLPGCSRPPAALQAPQGPQRSQWAAWDGGGVPALLILWQGLQQQLLCHSFQTPGTEAVSSHWWLGMAQPVSKLESLFRNASEAGNQKRRRSAGGV